MKLKVQTIDGGRGIILPQNVLEMLGDEEIQVTFVGRTAVLSRADSANDTEIRAALAYMSVKAKRRELFERLAEDDEDN